MESHEDILKFDKNEILVKLEKGEGTLKIEKVAVKKESIDEGDKEKKVDDSKVELTIVKNENEETTKQELDDNLSGEQKDDDSLEKQQEKDDENVDVNATEVKNEVKPEEKNEAESQLENEEEGKTTSETKPVEDEKSEVKQPKPDEESDLCSKQAAELKAMFPDLEVIQPLSRLSQVDTFVLRDKEGTGALDFSETTVAQLFNNAVKWPKEYAIQVRLQHIIYAVETKEWPATKNFSAYATGIGNEFDIPVHELPNDPPKRDSSTPMSLNDPDMMASMSERSHFNKKRKRHIAIDVETERAKLHALLNSSHVTNPKHGLASWDEDSEDSRRSTPVQSNLQPPPAHQQTTSSRLMTSMPPYDKYGPKTIGQTTVIPGTSSTLTPIDLSSR